MKSSAKKYANAYTIKVNKKSDKEYTLWITMIDIQKSLDVEHIYNLVRKKIHGRHEANNPTEQKIRKFKINASESFKHNKYLYAHEDIITPIIMHCELSAPTLTGFSCILGSNQHNIILNKEQSVLKLVINAFKGENIQTQCDIIDYKIDLCFCDYKLEIEVDEKVHKDRDINHEI